MIHRKVLSIVALLACVTLAGCGTQTTDTPTKQPTSSEQIDPANCIAAQAVVSCFLEGGRTYITAQQHLFCPEAKSLQIHSKEPQGSFTWKLTAQQFSRMSSGVQSNPAGWDLPRMLTVYAGFLYGGGFVSTDSLADGGIVTLDGQRYLQLAMPVSDNAIHAQLYRDLDTNRIDRIVIEDKKQGQSWLGVCYNWSYYSPKKLWIPRKIDIYDITDGVASKRLILQTEYKKVP